ncbi:MAG: RagB/SusD family nutrient uptake outer membrane protein [Bacteroidetes bacterium]|nr:RagB/SusD family nutrient uptake outer membrane protein [Bacteroidales bacterium]NJO67863.1 RagB/SusD family nutrient uptake outer membrane protein [Bacteroidota bacterium]
MHERRIELAFEGHRWLDLVRTGKVIEIMTKYGIKIKSQFGNISSDSYNVNESRFVYPIPHRETLWNSEL